jgi:hypothetical protein
MLSLGSRRVYSGLGVCMGGTGGREVIVGRPFSCICDIITFLLYINHYIRLGRV